jgi:Cu/Ag efflux protein CusF
MRLMFEMHAGRAPLEELDVKKAVIWTMGALLVANVTALAGSDPGAKPAAPLPSMQREKLDEVSATVTSIDQATRMVGLKAEDGSTSAFEVGPEVKNLPQVHVGDRVVVSYYRGIAAQVKPSGSAPSNKVKQIDLATQAKPGQRPMAGAGSAVQATVVIEKVDSKANTVTFKRPDGMSRTVTVESQEGKDFLKKIKKGDKVDVVYAEAVAIEVHKAT